MSLTSADSDSLTSPAGRNVTLRYFAWVREKVGTSEEIVDLPDGINTLAELTAWLKGRGDGFEAAFALPDVVRVAIDQQHAAPDTSIEGASEIAFFPPVTGG